MDAIRNTFVVGVDASPEASEALDWARRVAGPDDRIVVVHAWEVPLVTGYDMVVTIDPGEIEALSMQGLTELLGRVDDDRLEPVTHQGHAGDPRGLRLDRVPPPAGGLGVFIPGLAR